MPMPTCLSLDKTKGNSSQRNDSRTYSIRPAVHRIHSGELFRSHPLYTTTPLIKKGTSARPTAERAGKLTAENRPPSERKVVRVVKIHLRSSRRLCWLLRLIPASRIGRVATLAVSTADRRTPAVLPAGRGVVRPKGCPNGGRASSGRRPISLSNNVSLPAGRSIRGCAAALRYRPATPCG